MPKIDRLAIYERDAGLCGFCGELVPVERFHLDHKIAVGLGGEHSPENLRVAHPSCNQAGSMQIRRERRARGIGHDVGRGLVQVRIPGWIYNPLSELADKERRSLTAQLLIILERELVLKAEKRDA